MAPPHKSCPGFLSRFLCLYWLPDRPTKNSCFKGPLIAIARYHRESVDKDEPIQWKYIRLTITDWKLHMEAALYLTTGACLASISGFLPTMFQDLGYKSATSANLMTDMVQTKDAWAKLIHSTSRALITLLNGENADSDPMQSNTQSCLQGSRTTADTPTTKLTAWREFGGQKYEKSGGTEYPKTKGHFVHICETTGSSYSCLISLHPRRTTRQGYQAHLRYINETMDAGMRIC